MESNENFKDKPSKRSSSRLGIMISGGKDGLYASYLMKKNNYNLSCIITIKSKNPDSYMFHTPNIDITSLQAESMDLPLLEKETEGIKEKELRDLYDVIREAKEAYDIDGIVTGAIFSKYQKERIENICEELELEVYSPLWHLNQEDEMRSLLNEGFKIIFSSVACYGLGKKWLGKKITHRDVDELVRLNNAFGLNIAGEGGEFESLVLDCPMFKKRIVIKEKIIISESEDVARLLIKKAELAEKDSF